MMMKSLVVTVEGSVGMTVGLVILMHDGKIVTRSFHLLCSGSFVGKTSPDSRRFGKIRRNYSLLHKLPRPRNTQNSGYARRSRC